jgi:NADH dehydrogenase FAD-containing subunit
MKKVIIVGGGFAGSYCAKRLEDNFEVTLIDTKDFFEFTPSVLRVLVEPEHLNKIQILHKDYLRKTRLINGRVSKIDKKNVFVGRKKYRYDYIVISSGSFYGSPFKKENIVHPNRGIELRDYSKKLHNCDRILIVGGGLVGVELAGEIIDKYSDKDICLIQKSDRLVPRNNPKCSDKVWKYLSNKGVKLKLGETFYDKKNSDYDMIFFCTGIKPNLEFIKDSTVDEFLRVNGKKNMFIGGDAAGINEEKTAQNAVEHAKIIVENIKRLDKGRKLKEYKKKKRIYLISLGKKKGILEYGNFVWLGRIPALLKEFVEKKHMRKIRRF